MEYIQQYPARATPRIIIHGGAGNIASSMPPEKYEQYKQALRAIISKTNTYMNTSKTQHKKDHLSSVSAHGSLPSALEVATYAMVQLENNPLFNSGHGAVFTRDGINELEASLMVTRGRAKRAVGVTGLQHVKNPILLAKEMLERGEDDLWGKTDLNRAATTSDNEKGHREDDGELKLNVPSAQGHTFIHGKTAEQLAKQYGLELVGTDYFFTQNRWDEHIRALEREKKQREQQLAYPAGASQQQSVSATWSSDEYLPQGTCGAVAMDETGTICVATSTGGMTNKLTGRIGDTPSVGAGFWAEEWEDKHHQHHHTTTSALHLPVNPTDWSLNTVCQALSQQPAVARVSSSLRGVLADCLPSVVSAPQYTPLSSSSDPSSNDKHHSSTTKTIRATAMSGTGNGDSFLRIAAVRTVASIARWGSVPTREALFRVAGPGGELQQSAQDRWGKTGEGEGGIIGIESVVVRDTEGKGSGRVVRSEIVHDHNSTGMFRAWIDDDGRGKFQIWRDRGPDTVDLDDGSST